MTRVGINMKTHELFEQTGRLFYAYVISTTGRDYYAWWVVNTTDPESAREIIERMHKTYRRERVASKRQGKLAIQIIPTDYEIIIHSPQDAADMTYGESSKVKDPGFGNAYQFDSGS